MATAKTTSITLNGAYILAADARITDFKAALDDFVSKNPLLQVTTNDVVTDSPSLKAFKDGADLSKTLNISKPLTYFSNFDNKAALKAISDTAVGAISTDAMPVIGSPEVLATKLAAVPGTWSVISPVAYDQLVTTKQTISLKTADGSKLTITITAKDNDNSSNEYDFTSSNGAIDVYTINTRSNAAPDVPVVLDSKGKPKLVKVDPTIKLAYDDRTNSIIYTNLGGAGSDVITASLTQIKHAIFTTKREVLSAKVNYSNSLSYKDNDYQVDISSTKAVSSNSLTLSTSGTTNTVKISTYSILSEDFSISLTGKIQESWGANGITEVMTLKDVFLNTPEYSLKTASLISTNIYSNADYFTKSGLTNLDSYNLTDMTKMKEDALVGQPDAESPIPARVLPKILSGDNIITLKKAATVDGGTGKDVITGSAGNDSLMGGEGNDILTGENGHYTVDGGAGNDVITGSIGDDSLLGGDGSDTLTGGKDADTFSFQKSDFLMANAKGDFIFNKSVDTITDFSLKEDDSISFNDMGTLSFYFDLKTAQAANSNLFYVNGNVYFDINPSPNIYTPTLIIKLTGNPKVNDVPIVGGAGNDKLIGYIDDDDLIGNAGSDTLMGENGNDTLTGGDGSDKLTGGKGADTFNFETADFLVNKDDELVFNKSVDTITDFSKKDGDSINLNDLGSLEFPKTLAEARTANMPLFYINGSIYFDGDLDPATYTPTVIIKLTGNPKVNVDFSDFAS
ncbi:MAG: calcium-binding protein [Methylococcales bacterium]|nr:calcium-binding protein [Methylococcales bacterium]